MGLFSKNEHTPSASAPKTLGQRYAAWKLQRERDKYFYVRDNQLRDSVATGGYEFFSNYFKYGTRYGRILTLVESEQADRDMIKFWKILLIPQSSVLNDRHGEESDTAVFGAHGQLFDMIENKPKSWTSNHQAKADAADDMEEDTASSGITQQTRLSVRRSDARVIARDLASGDMYASTEYKVLLTARSLSDLDVATFRYRQYLGTQFDGLHFEVYEGQQKDDLHNLLRTADVQIGHHPMGTSSEFAGGYNILTRGITDDNGDYIGQMVGDVNNTAVLMDLDNFDDHVVLAHSARPTMLHVSSNEFDVGTRATTLLGVRLAQSALINNHRVIHLVLNDAHPQNLGADLSDITTVVSLNGGEHEGAINPFEVFGVDKSKSKQFGYFSAHVEKLRLMIKQISPSVDDVDLNDVFTNIIQEYYKDEEMLVDNPKENAERLKLVGLPHDQYPRLSKFLAYLNQQMDEAADNNNQRRVSRIEKVRSAFNTMKRDNGDLFDVVTNDDVDSADQSPQVVYDFSSLRHRGIPIAMAQFINAVQYATQTLGDRDLIIIHGTDMLADSVKPYVSELFKELSMNGVRIAFLYDSPEACLNDTSFNHLNGADWTMIGGFNKPAINKYQEVIQQDLPQGLSKSIVDYGGSDYGDSIYYVARGIDNVLFALDMNIGTRHNGQLSEHPKGFSSSSVS